MTRWHNQSPPNLFGSSVQMESLAGQILLASPNLTGPEFEQAVVLMVQHDQDGAMGLVLNRPMDQTIDEVWDEVSDIPCEHEDRLYRGGPCEGPLMAIHTQTDLGEMPIGEGLFFSVDRDHIEGVVAETDGAVKFFVGYAGWGPGQLEGELAQHAWIVLPGSLDRVFCPTDHQWQHLMKFAHRAAVLSQIDPRIIPHDPSMN